MSIAPTIYFGKEKAESEARLEKWLNEFPEQFEQQVREEIEAIMQKVLARAIELCPKDTGALASSISLEGGALEKSASGDFYEASIYAGNDTIINPRSGVSTAVYALLVHDGHMIGEYFFEGVPFLEASLAEFKAELESVVEKVLTEMNANREE